MTEGTVNVSKTLDLRGEGVIQVSDSDVVSSVSRDIDSALSLTEVDDGNSTIKLVDAQGAEVLGDAGNLQLQDKNGQILSSSAQRDIQQNGQKAAVGTYDYRLTSGVNNDGLYIGYGLTQLDLHATDSDALVLSSNGKSENAADLSAKITGSGDLAFSSQKGQTVSLSNKDNDYNRNNAGTTLLIQALTPGIIQAGYSVEQQREVFEFVASSDYFSGPTWMAMCKAAMDAAHGIEYSTVVTTMARNGVEFGLRVSGLPGQWFTGPAQQVIGPMFAGYKPEDSGLDIGDSAITETYGIGGFAMATAPAIVALVGGTVEEAIDFSRQMREITLGENPNVTIPLLGFMGVPSAIDITRVGSSGILPVINTAIAHKDAGVGMIGAGIVHPPFACFEKAILGWCERYGV
nr:DUF1116 domain-containing protein [Escherichia coli]